MNCPKIVPIPNSPCAHYIPTTNKKEAGYCKLPSMFRCIEALKHYSIKLSHSAIQDYLTCRRLFYIKHIAGLATRDDMISSAMKMGKLYDIMIGGMYESDADYRKHLHDYIESSKIDEFNWAMVNGFVRGMQEFVDPSLDGFLGLQQEFQYSRYDSINGDVLIHGFYDRLYENYFVESKFTAHPDIYTTHPFHILSQIGTYFLADEKLKYVVMEVARKPQLRVKDNETAEQFEKRIYSDFIKRPSYYLIGLDKNKRKFGRIFYRNEFDLIGLNERYGIVIREIREMMERDSYYHDETSCEKWGNTCPMLGTVCELNGKMNIENFVRRKKPGE